MIDAQDECYRVLQTVGYPICPEGDEEYTRGKKRKSWYYMVKIVVATPIGRLVASDHSMSSVGEMTALSDAFDKLKAKAGIATRAWDGLEVYMHKTNTKNEEK